MLVVIDESGCSGFTQASSTHFVIGMVIFDSFQDAEQTANTIRNLKIRLNIKREFKFSSSDNTRRDAFFEEVKNCRFSCQFLVIEKRLIYSDFLRENDDRFISYCLKLLVQSGMEKLTNATVKIDGTGNRKFKRECQSYLRRHVGPNIIRKISFCNSQTDVLIQLADMAVSAFARPFHNPDKQNAYRWRNMLDPKITNIWKFR